jgi:hypothetical protein
VGYFFKILYLALALLFAVAWFRVQELPLPAEIDPALLREPVQEDVLGNDFEFEYKGKDYHVIPQADYELWGLVVSQNDINAWFNYYHDKNSVNLKDVCVVWGENIRNGAYRDRKVSYKSGEWTCYYYIKGRLENPFYGNKLSNNHLLSDSEEIRGVIRQLNVGDQIRLSGWLVDYAEKGTNWYRSTSLSRDDTNSTSRSGGACEVMFVKEIELLGQSNLYWNILYRWKWLILAFVLSLHVAYFIWSIHRERRAGLGW